MPDLPAIPPWTNMIPTRTALVTPQNDALAFERNFQISDASYASYQGLSVLKYVGRLLEVQTLSNPYYSPVIQYPEFASMPTNTFTAPMFGIVNKLVQPYFVVPNYNANTTSSDISWWIDAVPYIDAIAPNLGLGGYYERSLFTHMFPATLQSDNTFLTSAARAQTLYNHYYVFPDGHTSGTSIEGYVHLLMTEEPLGLLKRLQSHWNSTPPKIRDTENAYQAGTPTRDLAILLGTKQVNYGNTPAGSILLPTPHVSHQLAVFIEMADPLRHLNFYGPLTASGQRALGVDIGNRENHGRPSNIQQGLTALQRKYLEQRYLIRKTRTTYGPFLVLKNGNVNPMSPAITYVNFATSSNPSGDSTIWQYQPEQPDSGPSVFPMFGTTPVDLTCPVVTPYIGNPLSPPQVMQSIPTLYFLRCTINGQPVGNISIVNGRRLANVWPLPVVYEPSNTSQGLCQFAITTPPFTDVMTMRTLNFQLLGSDFTIARNVQYYSVQMVIQSAVPPPSLTNPMSLLSVQSVSTGSIASEFTLPLEEHHFKAKRRP